MHRTLAYCDGVGFARRATAPALFSVALMDATCPPSTVYGAFHAYGGPREMLRWEYNGHEGGGILDEVRALEFLRERLSAGRGPADTIAAWHSCTARTSRPRSSIC